jgi:serine/threonine protein kinase
MSNTNICNVNLNNDNIIAKGCTAFIFKKNKFIYKEVYPVKPIDYGIGRSMKEYINDDILKKFNSPYIQTSLNKSICLVNKRVVVRYQFRDLKEIDYDKMDIKMMKKIIRDIINALKIFEKAKIKHNDIKDENLMYDKTKDNYVIIDLGRSRRVDEGYKLNNDTIYTMLFKFFGSIVQNNEKNDIIKNNKNELNELIKNLIKGKNKKLQESLKNYAIKYLVISKRQSYNKFQKMFIDNFSIKDISKN